MQIQVSGKQIDVGEALRSHVEERLASAIGKYFADPIDANVVFSREGNGYRVDCSVHVGHGVHAQARAEASEIYAGFDGAADRLEKRLRRYKRRLRNHRERERSRDQWQAQSYVLAPEEPEFEEELGEEFQPVVVAESSSEIHSRTVGEAVMEMDLADLPVVLFRNAGNGHLNAVYRRPDGHIGWIDLVEAEGSAES